MPHPGSPELRYALYERMVVAAAKITGLHIAVTRVADEGELERRSPPHTRAAAGYQDGVLYLSRATAMRLERLLNGDLYIHCRDDDARAQVLVDLTTDIVNILHELIHAAAANEARGQADTAFHEGIAELIAQRDKNAFVVELGLEKNEPGLLQSPFYDCYATEAAAVNVLMYAAARRNGQERRDEAMALAHDGNLAAVARRVGSTAGGPVRLFGRAGLQLALRTGFARVAHAAERDDPRAAAEAAGHRIGMALAAFILNVSEERAEKQLSAERSIG